jgi:hypothetical protein
MKICLISFDATFFDHNIILELKRKNFDAVHIDASKFKYKYKSFFDRLKINFNNKEFKKNKKQEAFEEYLVNQIKEIGNQDIILFIRPDKVSRETHLEIKKYSKKYLTYLYDSCKRFPIDNLLHGVFDEIFSFDIDDTEKYNFKFISNYIYLDKKELKNSVTNNNIFIVISLDERFQFLNKIAAYLSDQNINFKFIVVGKKIPKDCNKKIIYSKKVLTPNALQEDVENSKIFLDLIRTDHNGLSFRIFEALAMQRKIITTNTTIKTYDFYNPNNILVLNENSEIKIDPNFLNTPYEELNKDIYYKYTIENWVNTVFRI